ncbi:hypothetical protein [Streptomyces sp. NPDC002599]
MPREEDPFAPPGDGRHRPTCRTDMRQYTKLRSALFGRRSRDG